MAEEDSRLLRKLNDLIALVAGLRGRKLANADKIQGIYVKGGTPTDNHVLTYDATKKQANWEVTLGGGSGSMTTVKEAGVQVGDADIVTLDFGAGFDITETPNTEINVALDLSEITAGGELGGTMDAPTVDATHSGSAHHDQVTLAGTPNYITIVAQVITRALINLASHVTGTLPIGNGGTGQTAQQAAIDALTNVAAATNEHVLTKDTASGNAIFKAAAGGGGSHAVLSTTHSDSTPQTVSRGSLITGQSPSPSWNELVVGTSGQLLRSDGTDVAWATLYSIIQYQFEPDADPATNVAAGGPQGKFRRVGPSNETAVELWVDMETAPGTNVVVEIRQSDTTDLDTAAAFSSWTVIATFTATGKTSSTTSFTTSTLTADRILGLNINSISGSAPQDLVIHLEAKRPLTT